MPSPTRATTRLILEKGQPAAHTGRRLRTAAAAAAGKIEARRGEERERKEAVELMRRERGERTHTHAGGGFPKQLAAISTDPIKINERAREQRLYAANLRRPAAAAAVVLFLLRVYI